MKDKLKEIYYKYIKKYQYYIILVLIIIILLIIILPQRIIFKGSSGSSKIENIFCKMPSIILEDDM